MLLKFLVMNGFSECKAPFGVHPLHCSAPGADGAAVKSLGAGEMVLRRSVDFKEPAHCRTGP